MMENQSKGIDLQTAYKVIIRAYIRNHSLYEGQKVQYRRDKRWEDAVAIFIGLGPWDDRMVQLRFEDGTEMEVHSEQLRVSL